MKITFLHISDLHFISNWHEGTELVLNRFFDDVAGELSRYNNLYLVFSGDAVKDGAQSEAYTALLDKLNAALDSIGLPHKRRVCVPGNHDISRDKMKPWVAIQKGTLSELTDEHAFNDAIPQLGPTIFEPKFSHYVEWEKAFASFTSCTESIGGTGWTLPDGIGVYCLNTALCSFAGLSDLSGKVISDEKRLMIDTRSLNRWLADTQGISAKVLVMHHPTDWLQGWARNEVETVIARNFDLVFLGHVHQGITTFSSHGLGASIQCIAPPLFTHKGDALGYSFVTVDTIAAEVTIDYRQWAPHSHKFLKGTVLAGNDTGTIVFPFGRSNDSTIARLHTVQTAPNRAADTLSILQAEFDEATTCYSSKKRLWVDRDLASVPETDESDILLTSQRDLLTNLRSCIIRGPKQFGLTCLGRWLALEYYRQSREHKALVMLDIADSPHHKQIGRLLNDKCAELKIERGDIAGIILDNWQSDKQSRRILSELKADFPQLPFIILRSADDSRFISSALEIEDESSFESLYLWALSRSGIRQLVVSYIKEFDSLDDDLVTKKVTEDIDALNIYRTPINCLLILKLTEQAFDDSPVNRTEMIGRVLYLLFYQFDKIPRYATRPDLKDCEYALGFFCENLVRSGRTAFSRTDFHLTISQYCKSQLLDLDIEILFSFLATENIFIRKGHAFEFRFTYWLYFFAAHRMHHNPQFAEFILSDRRYSAHPEIIEFYAGIDRRRTDAIQRLTADLSKMNEEFLERTGLSSDFNPFSSILWTPNAEGVERLKKEIADGIGESALPASVKDRIADSNYNRAKPYRQELAKFIEESTLNQMIQGMKGASRALRNSDHVSPEEKTKLLEAVVSCWVRVAQILALISPILAFEKKALFEDMLFVLARGFDQESTEKRWQEIITAIPLNVVAWHHENLFSKKMGALLSNYTQTHEGELGEALILLLMVHQRPNGWDNVVERFIVRQKKNSFYLGLLCNTLEHEYRVSFSTERTRQELRRLTAMALAKHTTGVKHPNNQLVKKAAALLDKNIKDGRDSEEIRK